jgi:hypothetical protein
LPWPRAPTMLGALDLAPRAAQLTPSRREGNHDGRRRDRARRRPGPRRSGSRRAGSLPIVPIAFASRPSRSSSRSSTYHPRSCCAHERSESCLDDPGAPSLQCWLGSSRSAFPRDRCRPRMSSFAKKSESPKRARLKRESTARCSFPRRRADPRPTASIRMSHSPPRSSASPGHRPELGGGGRSDPPPQRLRPLPRALCEGAVHGADLPRHGGRRHRPRKDALAGGGGPRSGARPRRRRPTAQRRPAPLLGTAAADTGAQTVDASLRADR